MSQSTSNGNNSAWKPAVSLDMTTAKAPAFEEAIEKFTTWAKSQPTKPMPLKTGWHTITPEIAEQLLRFNGAGINRDPMLNIALYYYLQMKAGDWKPTGQPLIFDEEGNLIDGQHRLWGCYFGGVPFITFVVTGVKKQENLFAYIDNAKSRTAANALQTAGMNGVSSLIVKVLDWAYSYEHGLFHANRVRSHQRISPVQYLHSLAAHPNAREAAKLAVTEYKEATALADKEVVAFATMLMMDEGHDELLIESFFYQLGGIEETEIDGAVMALIKLFEKDNAKLKDGMMKHQKLANVIKAFNLWIISEKPKKNWSFRVDEDFPRLVRAEKQDEDLAAE
jgi:hypothetical protein